MLTSLGIEMKEATDVLEVAVVFDEIHAKSSLKLVSIAFRPNHRAGLTPWTPDGQVFLDAANEIKPHSIGVF